MANLTSANVTVISSWTTGSTNGKRNKVRRVKWTSTTAGGGTNRLLASAFGYTKILNCSSILLDATTKKIYPAVPSADGSEILVMDPAAVTDADRDKVIDLATSTDYAHITLEGV
jgi:hypothetical protein